MIKLENNCYSLNISEECVATSLICKETGEECIKIGEEMPLFSLTEERPYNNEIKLAHPNKKTVFQANRVRKEDNNLIVGFELLGFEAVVSVNIQDTYIGFKLEKFNVESEHFYGLDMDTPPVLEFRLIQLPIKNREKFGEWLNVSWDEKVAINVLATSIYTLVDSEKHGFYRVLYAGGHRDIDLFGCEAALICTTPDKLLDCIEKVEEDYKLPSGVRSRRNPKTKESVYWVSNLVPENADEHIYYAKKGGFSKILFYYKSFFKDIDPYLYCNDFELRDEYIDYEAVKNVIQKVKNAGLIPGMHFLHTHIGTKSKYVTPVADYRLNLTRHFTLSRSLGTDDTEIYVAQNPKGSVMHEKCRVLNFDGELIYYENYTKEPPYKFTGCKRGYFETNIIPHKEGTIGGILDISEYGTGSVYIDQETDLQDEIAQKLAQVCDLGMEFLYFDGSEGTDAPYEFEVPYAQYRVYKALKNEPIYGEGAAKSHFSWHMLAGGNAFDIFPPAVFKKSIAKYPYEEAPRMSADFTQVDFGWWKFYDETQPDMFEYGTSLAASYDCPVTLMGNIEGFKKHARCDDILEVLRRWEDVRRRNWLTQEQKEMLRNPDQEHTLLINGKNEYELVPYSEIKNVAAGNEKVRAFVFERLNNTYVVCWHASSDVELFIPMKSCDFVYEASLDGEKIPVKDAEGGSVIHLGNKCYLRTKLTREEVVKAFEGSKLL